MSTICIGGVCVPYTAVVPLFFICLRWVLQKAVELGLLPKSLQEKLFPAAASGKYEPVQNGETSVATETCSSAEAGTVMAIESEDHFREVLKQNKVVVKATAEWCRPCKEIQPEYAALAAKFTNVSFYTVDVDELDDVASEYNVAMMPTFLVFKEGKVHETKTGIDLLGDFMQRSLA